MKSIIRVLKKRQKDIARYNGIAGLSNVGALLVFAHQVYEAGFESEANRMADLLINNSLRDQILFLAVSNIADSKYEQLYSDYKRSGDIAVFVQKLEQLVKEFHGGWVQEKSANTLLDKMRASADAGPGLPDCIKTLPDESQKLYTELKNVTQASPIRGLWILSGGTGTRNSGPISAIQDGGLKYVPLLIAMLNDGSASRLDFNALNNRGRSNNSSISGNYNQDELFLTLPRQALMREIAATFLVKFIPRSRDFFRYRANDYSSLIELSNLWHEEYKGRTEKELAEGYLNDSNSENVVAAVNYFMNEKGDEYNPMIEKALLVRSPDYNTINSLRSYMQKRGKKGKAFLDKVIKKHEGGDSGVEVEDQNADENGMYLKTPTPEYYDDNSDDYIKQQLDQMLEMVGGEDAAEVISKLVSGAYKINKRIILK